MKKKLSILLTALMIATMGLSGCKRETKEPVATGGDVIKEVIKLEFLNL